MFAGNGKISNKQLCSMLITEKLGLMAMLAGHLAGELTNIKYVWVLFLGMGIEVFSMWIAFRLSYKYWEKIGNSKLFKVVTVIRFMVMAAAGSYILFVVLDRLLLKNTWEVLIMAGIIGLGVFLAKCDREARGRMHEILIYLTVVPLVIILVTAGVKSDISYGWMQVTAHMPGLDAGKVALIVFTFLMMTYHENLIVMRNSLENIKEKKLLLCPVLTWTVGIIVFVICSCTYGSGGSFLDLMDIGGIPGGFLGRQESIMAVFIIVSMMSYVSGMFTLVWENAGRKIYRFLIPAIFIGLIIFAGQVEGRDLIGEEKSIIGAVEIEDWDFVVSVVQSEDRVIFEIADVEGGENKYIEYDTGSLQRAQNMHISAGYNLLDFSHLKAILLVNIENIQQVVDEYIENTDISGNVLVYKAQTTDITGDFSLGEKLENLEKNQDEYKDSHLFQAGISLDNIKTISLSDIQ